MLSWCDAPCAENVLVSAVPSSQILGLLGATAINGNSATPALLSHETAHSLGFGHCNLNNGAVCWASSTLANAYTDGNMFWTPRARDVMALKALYP